VSYEMKNDTATIFVNDRKTEETHADLTGTAKISGVEYYVNGWRREGKGSGKKYLALTFKVKEPKEDKSSVPFNDAVPFAPEFR
jgi:hypothetical protein